MTFEEILPGLKAVRKICTNWLVEQKADVQP